MRREENQLDVTECFIALMIRSTHFGHFYAHHQELETVCVLVPPMVCSAVRVKYMISVKQRYVCSEFCGDCVVCVRGL